MPQKTILVQIALCGIVTYNLIVEFRSLLRFPALAYLLERVEIKRNVVLCSDVHGNLGIVEEERVLRHTHYVCVVARKIMSGHGAEYHRRIRRLVDNVLIVTRVCASISTINPSTPDVAMLFTTVAISCLPPLFKSFPGISPDVCKPDAPWKLPISPREATARPHLCLS